LEAKAGWELNDDVADILGITKYIPPIPSSLNGEVFNAGMEHTVKYDIENFKAFPNALMEGEDVVFTEKIHGTFAMFVLLPNKIDDGLGGKTDFIVASKGLGARGLAFKSTFENLSKNLYLRAAQSYTIEDRMKYCHLALPYASDMPVAILGEIFGSGVQDLAYGSNAGQNDTIGFRVFDIAYGFRSQQRFYDDYMLDAACAALGLKRVPALYRGPFSREVMDKYTNGYETISGKDMHIREGIVMRPRLERRVPDLGRVQLKSVSEAYLLRKGGTEYN
jgi:RNA ligase (TIGR02306 family)